MDRTLDGLVMRATVVLLAAGLLLVAAGTAGLDGSLALALALGAVGGGLYLLAETLDEADATAALGVRDVATDLWLGPLLAAAVVGLWLGATPAEVQALGGIVGLLGMLNYFLRPFYHLFYGIVGRVADV